MAGNPDEVIGRFFKPEQVKWSKPDPQGRRTRVIEEVEPETVLPKQRKKDRVRSLMRKQRRQKKRESNVISKIMTGALGYGAGVPSAELGQIAAKDPNAQKIISFMGVGDTDAAGNPLSSIDVGRIQRNIDKLKGRDLLAFNRMLDRQQKRQKTQEGITGTLSTEKM